MDDINWRDECAAQAKYWRGACECRMDEKTEEWSQICDYHQGLAEHMECLEIALRAAVDWAMPMAEAPQASRPKWFDIARLALSATAAKADAQKIVDGFMEFHGSKTTKTNPDCPACESGHGLLGSGCICGSTANRGGKP